MTNDSSKEKKDDKAEQTHTFTPRSHEELLRKFSRNSIQREDVKNLKRENEALKRELNKTTKTLDRLLKRTKSLEEEKHNIENKEYSLSSLPKWKHGEFESEIYVNNKEDYVRSCEVLDHHFNEVIRRYQDILSEKDRLIRELTSKSRGISIEAPKSTKRLGTSDCKDETDFHDRDDGSDNSADDCDCNCAVIAKSLIPRGEDLHEHFSEVIRRHKNKIAEKDEQIRELREALEMCVNQTPSKQKEQSKVQGRHHEYTDSGQSQTLSATSSADDDKDLKVESADTFVAKEICVDQTTSKQRETTEVQVRFYENSDSEQSQTLSTASSADDDEELPVESADTFVAIDKCQRLESIANLERLRQQIMQRLELEEKLDKLYWQTELTRYQKLRTDGGDSSDPDCCLNRDFEILERTRLELLSGLNKLKDSTKSEPTMYVKPHILLENDSNT